MPLYLLPPGSRIKTVGGKPYPNRHFLVRGDFEGRVLEVSTKTGDEATALRFKAQLELELLDRRIPRADEAVTFLRAAELYAQWREPSKIDERRIDRLKATLGHHPVADVRHADLVEAAKKLYPGRKPETWNRGVIKPAAAILHYAARNGWCPWLRIERFREGPVVTRAAAPDTASTLLTALRQEETKATTPLGRNLARKKQLLIVWLFRHFNRISDPLRLTWEDHVDLERRTYLLFIGKTGVWREKPMHREVFEILSEETDRTGYLFPWRTRSGVYKWLRPLTRRLKVRFTPHMARHFGGKHLNAGGAGLKTIMGALDHTDPSSSIRYQDADLDIVRGAIDRLERLEPRGALGKKLGKTSRSRRNA